MLFRVERDREAFLAALERRGVLMLSFMPHNGQIRAVTHYGIERSDIEATIRAVREAARRAPARRRSATSSSRAPTPAQPPEPAAPPRCRTATFGGVELTRAAAGADSRARSTNALYDLVEARFRRVVESRADVRDAPGHPRLGRPPAPIRRASASSATSRADRAHLAAIEAIDPAGLSAEARFERDLELHHVRLDALPGRDDPNLGAPLHRRLGARRRAVSAVHARLRAAARAPRRDRRTARGRAAASSPATERAPSCPRSRPWLEIELRASASVPRFLDEIARRGGRRRDAGARRRPRRGSGARSSARRSPSPTRRSGSAEILPGATPDWQLGRERYGELLALRAFDGLDAEAILEIG